MPDFINQLLYYVTFENILPIGLLIGVTLIGWIVEVVVIRRLYRWSKRSRWQIEEIIVGSLRRQVLLWSFLLGLNLAVTYSPVRPTAATMQIIGQISQIIFILSFTLIAANILTGLLNGRNEHGDGRPVLSIISNITRAVVFIIGGLIALQTLHIDITPLVAALGITGLAISLAMQATLTDVISGLQIIFARQIRPGDYVKLESGDEGFVTDINWRTTRIRQLSNNDVIIPNAKLTTSILTNFHEPERPLIVEVPASVDYNSDLDLVEQLAIAVAHEVMQAVPGGMADKTPVVYFTEFGDTNIRFVTHLAVREFTDQYQVKHEFIKRLHVRLRAAGIDIPSAPTTYRILTPNTIAAN